MANTLLTPSIIAKEALMVLRNNAVMANLVHRDYSGEFVGGVGDTITIRTPATFEAKEFTGASITVQDATEQGVAVKMDKHLDVSFAVTSTDMTLKIQDFSEQFLVPAMQAFANKIDMLLLTEGQTAASTNKVTQASDVTVDDVLKAREFLTKNAAPLADRRFVYDSATETQLLTGGKDLFVNASAVGDEGTALREASLGRKFGLDFYVDQNMDSGSITAKALAFHKNALALVTRPLALPQGAAKSAVVNYDGFGLRVVYGYDMNTKKDTVSIDMLCGVKALNKKLISQIAGG